MGLAHPRYVQWAAQEGRAADLAYHLERGGKEALRPSLSSEKRQAPIHLAAARGHIQCVKLLHDAGEAGLRAMEDQGGRGSKIGSGLDVKDKDGHAPLHLAISNQHYSTVRVLLELGANVDPCTRFGVTPLHLAASVGHTPCVELLSRHGAGLNAQESWGQTPLAIATLGGRLVAMKILLELGADPEIKDYQHSQTPLHIACASKDEERVLLLLDAGCDIHATDGLGRSPLGVAIVNKFYRVVPLLLEYGSSLNSTDRSTLSAPLLQYLDQLTESPLSLSQMCRVVIRKSLKPTHNQQEDLEGLKLPPHIVQYLCSILDVCEGEVVKRKAVEGVPMARQMILQK